ncbi:recQ-mediated genome instability protein 1 [Rhinophrynus dorsalis]
MDTSGLAVRVKMWLASTWHVKVPDPWLEACINWIQQENNSSSLPQAEMNKQVFEQWLLTDLRDLEDPVLPAGILDSLKMELNGFYAIQIDSLVDVSLPAYSQLQKLRGKDNVNEHVTATTQVSQKPWEAKPTRMLMLQLTDGIQHIQGMEYRPIPAFHASLSPGTKLLLQGTIVCRLGVLLLKPENVKVLGGEVEALVEEYTQDKVLSRIIGIEDNPVPQRPTVQEQDSVRNVDEMAQALGPSDEDLLASLDESEEFTINNGATSESGYYSRSENSTMSSFGHQQTQDLRAGQPCFPMSNQTVQENSNNVFVEQYDLDDELFLEEEIQRELEEMSMNQSEVTYKNLNLPTENLTHTANSSASSSSRCGSADSNLDNQPFTYLSSFLTNKSSAIKCVRLKAFIVTLNGNLTSNCGFWNIKAKISDGTDYLDVEFSDDILTKLIGFSVPEMRRLKRNPGQQNTLMAGLQKCQRELTDFCGIMTVSYNPTKSEATVLALQDVHEEIMHSLERRINLQKVNSCR